VQDSAGMPLSTKAGSLFFSSSTNKTKEIVIISTPKVMLLSKRIVISIASFCVTRAFATSGTMRAEIFLVRHGETTANRDGVLQGQCDFPLTEKGEREASQVGTALADVSFTKLYASDLRRVQHTTEIMMSGSKSHTIEQCIPSALLRYVS